MPTYVYYIIIGVVVFSVYIYFMAQKANKIKNSHLDDFNARYSNTPLTDRHKEALVFGAILFLYRLEDPTTIKLEGRYDESKLGLSRQWNVTDHNSATETLDTLLALTRSRSIDTDLPSIKQGSDFTNICTKIAKELKISVDKVKETQSTYAWDIVRAVSVAKWCFWCGYLTESETWDYIIRASSIAKELGKGWDEYSCSFLIGRTIQGFDLDDVIIETGQLLNGKSKYGNIYPIDTF